MCHVAISSSPRGYLLLTVHVRSIQQAHQSSLLRSTAVQHVRARGGSNTGGGPRLRHRDVHSPAFAAVTWRLNLIASFFFSFFFREQIEKSLSFVGLRHCCPSTLWRTVCVHLHELRTAVIACPPKRKSHCSLLERYPHSTLNTCRQTPHPLQMTSICPARKLTKKSRRCVRVGLLVSLFAPDNGRI